MLYVFLFLCFLVFGGIAMTIGEGLWNNTLLLFTVTFAALVAVFGGPALGLWGLDMSGAKGRKTPGTLSSPGCGSSSPLR